MTARDNAAAWLDKASDRLELASNDPDEYLLWNVYEACIALLAEHDALLARVAVTDRAMLWLDGDDTGMSSEAICRHMLGMPPHRWVCDPADPADLGRCLRLLELFPEWKPRIGEMAAYSTAWAALVARWDELAAMMADEVGIDWSKGRKAPKTYAAMKIVRLPEPPK